MRATPDFDFQLGESAKMIRDSVARFAADQRGEILGFLLGIAPAADLVDAEVGMRAVA